MPMPGPMAAAPYAMPAPMADRPFWSSPGFWAARWSRDIGASPWLPTSSVLGVDGLGDVDGGEQREDVRLQERDEDLERGDRDVQRERTDRDERCVLQRVGRQQRHRGEQDVARHHV